jgi:hypothetical protein
MTTARFAVVLLTAVFAQSFAAPSYAADAARLAVQNQNATDLSAQERRYYVRPRVRVYRIRSRLSGNIRVRHLFLAGPGGQTRLRGPLCGRKSPERRCHDAAHAMCLGSG